MRMREIVQEWFGMCSSVEQGAEFVCSDRLAIGNRRWCVMSDRNEMCGLCSVREVDVSCVSRGSVEVRDGG